MISAGLSKFSTKFLVIYESSKNKNICKTNHNLSLAKSYLEENGATRTILSKSFFKAKSTAIAVQTLYHQSIKSSLFNHFSF
jgi:hypothetical protein